MKCLMFYYYNYLYVFLKRNISKIRVYKDDSLKTIYERNMDNPFIRVIEDEYPLNVPYNASISVYISNKEASYQIADKLKSLGCEIVRLANTSFVCNYNKESFNPLSVLSDIDCEHTISVRYQQ